MSFASFHRCLTPFCIPDTFPDCAAPRLVCDDWVLPATRGGSADRTGI